jgi:hypothetical protein
VNGNDLSLEEVKCKDADTSSVVDYERKGMPFLVNRDSKTGNLFIKSMEEIVTGSVGCVTGTRETGAAERPLGYLPILRSGKKGSPVLHFYHPVKTLLTQNLHGVLVGKIVASLDSIKGMIFPGIFHRSRRISQRGIDTPLGSNRVRPEGVDLGKDRHVQTGFLGLYGCSQTCQATANYQNIVRKKFHGSGVREFPNTPSPSPLPLPTGRQAWERGMG